MPAEGCSKAWLVIGDKFSKSKYGLLTAIHCIFEIICGFLNVVIFIAIMKLRRTNTRRNTLVLLNVVVTDLIYTFTGELAYIVNLILQLCRETVCQVVTFIEVFGLFLCIVSFLMLVVATMERYIAIFHPFRHNEIMSSYKCAFLICLVYVIGVSLTAMFKLSRFGFAAGVTVLTVLVIGGIMMSFAFVRIFILSKRLKAQIVGRKLGTIGDDNHNTTVASRGQATQPQTNTRNLSVISGPNPTQLSLSEEEQNRATQLRLWKRDRRNAILIALLLICLLACYLPYLIGVSLFVFAKSKVYVSKELLHWLWAFMLINSTLNPVFFFFFDKEIRYHIFKIFGCENRVAAETEKSYFSRGSFAGRPSVVMQASMPSVAWQPSPSQKPVNEDVLVESAGKE